MVKIPRLCLVVILLFSAGLTAQSKGKIHGNVTDSSNNEIPGVTIRLTNTQTKTVYQMNTDTTGSFQFEVPAGTYEISAYLKGFEERRFSNLKVKDGATLSQDFVLMIAPRK